MDWGAIGFSTGLRYTHAKSATASEIMDLTEVTADFGGVYSTYLRNESDQLIESVEEAIHTAQETKVGLHISHLKASGKKNWHLFEGALNSIEAAAQLAASQEGSTVKVLSVGPASIDESKVKKNILSRGVDELYFATNDALEHADARATAQALSLALQDVGGWDVVISSRFCELWFCLSGCGLGCVCVRWSCLSWS